MFITKKKLEPTNGSEFLFALTKNILIIMFVLEINIFNFINLQDVAL